MPPDLRASQSKDENDKCFNAIGGKAVLKITYSRTTYLKAHYQRCRLQAYELMRLYISTNTVLQFKKKKRNSGEKKMANESQTDYEWNMSKSSRPETIVIINCVLNAPLILISIIGNTLVLSAVMRTPSLRLPSITLLCSLAVSDLLVGLVVQPLYIARGLTENDSLQQALSIIAFAVCAVSLWSMTAISVDRFLALHYHMRYPTLMTTHRAMYTSAALWLVACLLSFLVFWNRNAFYFASGLSIVICLLISTVCYIQIYRIVKRHQLQIHVQQQAVESNAENSSQNMSRLTKSAKNTFIYYIVMILSYTPLFTSMSFFAMSRSHGTNAWVLADTLAFMNSSINPFLYCWRLRELRTAVVKTAKQMLCRQTEEI